jgi:hypothetical protein
VLLLTSEPPYLLCLQATTAEKLALEKYFYCVQYHIRDNGIGDAFARFVGIKEYGKSIEAPEVSLLIATLRTDVRDLQVCRCRDTKNCRASSAGVFLTSVSCPLQVARGSGDSDTFARTMFKGLMLQELLKALHASNPFVVTESNKMEFTAAVQKRVMGCSAFKAGEYNNVITLFDIEHFGPAPDFTKTALVMKQLQTLFFKTKVCPSNGMRLSWRT